MQILFVEDDVALALLVKKRLEQFRETVLECVTVDTLEDAKRFLSVARPDVILLDLELPDSRGLETFYSVEACAREVPIVICSGNEETSTVQRAIDAGAHGFVPKGRLKPKAIAFLLEHAIRMHRIRMIEVMANRPPIKRTKVPVPGKLDDTHPELYLITSEEEDTDPGNKT